jgi:hypothetical protein
MPSTAVCMNCHKQIWADSPYLEPVRTSFKTGKPLEYAVCTDKGPQTLPVEGLLGEAPIEY